MKRRRSRISRTRKLRVEQLCRRELLAGDMTNPGNSLDVNNDDHVTAADALSIINYIDMMNNKGEGEQVNASAARFPDTNGDSRVTAGDALRVVNHLNVAATAPSIPTVQAHTAETTEEAATPTATVTTDGGGRAEATAPSTPSVAAGTAGGASCAGTGGEVFGQIVDTGNSPRIKFSAVDTTVTVSSPNAGQLQITMSHDNSTQTLDIKDGFRLQVIGRNNCVIFDGAQIPDDLKVEIVDGSNNMVQLFDTFVGDDFIYRGNGGHDNLLLGHGAVIADTADIHTRDGNDTIHVDGARIGDDFILHTHDGNDTLDVDDALVGDDAIVRFGDDNDVAILANIQVGDVADIKGNSGFDILTVDVSTVSARKFKFDGFQQINQN